MHFFPIFGGQEMYIYNLNQLLSDSGIDISVVQPSRPLNKNKPKYVHYLPCLRFIGRYLKGIDWFWFNLMLKLKKRFLKKQDVIVLHYSFHYPVISWHDNIILVSHGLDWAEPPKLSFDKYKKDAAIMAKNNGVKIVANDTSFLRALGIDIKPGEHFFKEVSKNIWFIPNCIDITKFYNKDKEREKIILVPRNIRRARGIHLAIEAFNLFSRKHKDFTMQIVGGQLSGKYYKYCLGLVKQYSLENKIQFSGNIPNDALVDIYNKSAITLIPTIAFEGTSISALESMACKTPVVSTEVGGLADLPGHKVKTSPEHISKGLIYVLNSWNSESERQYAQTVDMFNLDNWKIAWLNAINK